VKPARADHGQINIKLEYENEKLADFFYRSVSSNPLDSNNNMIAASVSGLVFCG
jgi:hypothetical protein